MLPDSALEEVKRDLRSMLISEKGGVPLRNIQNDYEMLSCNRLPFKDLGFNDVQSFMRSIPDVAREVRGPTGEVSYFAVCDASTSHIQKLVSNQKSKKKKAPKFPMRGRGGGRGGGGVTRGSFRGRGGGRGGGTSSFSSSFLSRPPSTNYNRPDSSFTPARPRPPQSMRGGGRWQRGGIPRSASAADPSIGQSGDWRNKGSGNNLSTFINGPIDRNRNGDWDNRLNQANDFKNDEAGEWDKENQTSSPDLSPIRNLRIGIDSKGNRTIDSKANREIDLREQINNSRASNDIRNVTDNNVTNGDGIQLSGDLRQKLNAMRSAYEETEKKNTNIAGGASLGSSGGGGGSFIRGRGAVNDVPQDNVSQDYRGSESSSGSSGNKRGNYFSRQNNNSNNRPFNKTNPTDVPPRFRKQAGGTVNSSSCFVSQEVKAEPMSPIQHTEKFEDKTESKNWVPPENGQQYLEAFHDHFLRLGIPAPTINVVMGKVERQKGFYGQISYDNKLYYPLEILHTEEEAQQNAARAFCLKMGISLSSYSTQPPSSSSPTTSSDMEVVRKKIYDMISDGGTFSNALPAQYKEKYKEDLPPDFLSSLKQATHLFNIENPFSNRFIIYKVPEAMVRLAQVVQREEGLADSQRHHADPSTASSAVCQQSPILPHVGSQLDVLFSFAYSGEEIYLQKAEQEDLLYQIEEVLQTLSQQLAPSPSTDLSKCLIAACYEGGWYRARVRTRSTHTVSVSFIDYGNKEEVTSGDVRLLPDNKLVTVTPPLAIPCCLQKPTGTEWKEDVASFFLSLSEKEPVFSAKVLDHRDNLCVVELYSQKSGDNLNDKVAQPIKSTSPTPDIPPITSNPSQLSPSFQHVTEPTPTSTSLTPPPPHTDTTLSSPSTPPKQQERLLAESVVEPPNVTPMTAAVAAMATPTIQQSQTSAPNTLSTKQKNRLFAEDPEPLCLPESGLFGVYVCRVLSESSVLLRIVDDEYSDKLDELENKIAECFQSWTTPKEVHKSNVYACVIAPGEEDGEENDEGNKFYRVRVLHKKEGEIFECYLLDHGDHEFVHKENLRDIDSTLNASLSYQAILASLHGLDSVLPEHRAIAVEALIKFTITECNTFMAMRKDGSAPQLQEFAGSSGGDSSSVDHVVVNRVRKIVSVLPEIDQAKVATIYRDVYKENLDNVEEIIRHIPGYGFWKKSLEVELVDTSQDEDFNINVTMLSILEEVSKLQAEGKDGQGALYNYFGGPDSGSASVDGTAFTADSVRSGTYSNIGNLATSLDHQLDLTNNGGSNSNSAMGQQNSFGYGGAGSVSVSGSNSMDRVCSYVQEQADSVAVVSDLAAALACSNYQQPEPQQQNPSPQSSSGRSLYTWSTNVNNVKNADWISSRPFGDNEIHPEQQLQQLEQQNPYHAAAVSSGFPPLPHWYGFELNNFSALFILHAESPSNFVAIPYDMRQTLLNMEAELALYFSSPQKSTEVLSTSSLYGVYKDGVWYRTLYISSIEHLHCVLYPDYHQYDTVSLDQLYPLPEQFYTLPFLGRKMALGGIAPTSQDWPESVKFWFIQATRHKSMYGLIWDNTTNDDENPSNVPKPLRAQLIDTSGEEDVIVDDVLCEKGWARHIAVGEEEGE